MSNIGEDLVSLGEVTLPSGAKYEVVKVRTGKSDAASVRYFSATGSRREVVVFAGAAAAVAQMLDEFAADQRRYRNEEHELRRKVRAAPEGELLQRNPALAFVLDDAARYWLRVGRAKGIVDALDQRVTREEADAARRLHSIAVEETKAALDDVKAH